ncbi:hypothetical protein HZC53_06195 [Candidatus Uhrbacteria bacterium]|nr:hypothetical protein [Candidatus Uhrbacteria bacterium]
MKTQVALKSLASRYAAINTDRRKLQELSQLAQRNSKQSIFALQRGEVDKSDKLLVEAEEALAKGLSLIKKQPRLNNEGMWRASLEEYCEACFFDKAIKGKDLFPPQRITDEPDILIGGLSDLIGEFVRLATKAAIEHDAEKVDELYGISEGMVEFLLSLDATGNLRNKIDQARQHLRKLEEIRYDLAKIR